VIDRLVFCPIASDLRAPIADVTRSGAAMSASRKTPETARTPGFSERSHCVHVDAACKRSSERQCRRNWRALSPLPTEERGKSERAKSAIEAPILHWIGPGEFLGLI
jgi:hypothetical protein